MLQRYVVYHQFRRIRSGKDSTAPQTQHHVNTMPTPPLLLRTRRRAPSLRSQLSCDHKSPKTSEEQKRRLRQRFSRDAALARRAAALLDVQPIAPIPMPAVPAAQGIDGLRVAGRRRRAGRPLHGLAVRVAKPGLSGRRTGSGTELFRAAGRASGSGQAHRSFLVRSSAAATRSA